MILDDLCNFYNMKVDADDPDMPRRGWCVAKVAWEFRIDADGRLVSVLPLGSADGKRNYTPKTVPEQETRSSGIKPYFLCEKAAYFLGIDDKRGDKLRKASCDLHHQVLDGIEDEAAGAVLLFLDGAGSADFLSTDMVESLKKGGLAVFRYLPDQTLVHERPKVRDAWQQYLENSDEGPIVQCAITGKRGTAAKLFPMLRGFPGAQSSGAALVSFNRESFCSYGKSIDDQAYNASISNEVAYDVGAALRYLMQSGEHHTSLGSTQVLFWTDGKDQAGDDLLALLLRFDSLAKRANEDETLLQEIQARLIGLRNGRDTVPIDRETRYYILGLSPNAARLSVRFFETGTLGILERRFGQYLSDIEMVDRDGASSQAPSSLRAYVNQTAPLGKSENVPDVLTSSVMSAMLRGEPFPSALFLQLLARTRADKGFSINQRTKKRYDAMYLRAAMLKACLLRSARRIGDKRIEGSITVSLNEDNRDIGYLLGRLFAVLEKAQEEAIPGANATIRDRYIGSASATPARVFPQLLKMSQHHISKATYGKILDRRLQEIMNLIDADEGFPTTLSYDEQGQFFIGYYQQKSSLYAPKSAPSDNNEQKES